MVGHDRRVTTDDADEWGGHVPALTPDEIDRIAAWHERAYREGRSEGRSTQTFEYLGATLVVPPDVQPITRVSHVLGDAVLAEVRRGERVLDMGTGSGVNAVLAAMAGAHVIAVDISPVAVEAACENASRNGVADMTEVRVSDVFSDVDEQFDLIIFDPPYRWFRPRDLFEHASTDHGYRAMSRFMAEARGHLLDGGRMLVSFGSSGDLAYLRQLIVAAGFSSEVVAHRSLTRDAVTVDYFTFRLV